jgi:hypothetical protein
LFIGDLAQIGTRGPTVDLLSDNESHTSSLLAFVLAKFVSLHFLDLFELPRRPLWAC